MSSRNCEEGEASTSGYFSVYVIVILPD